MYLIITIMLAKSDSSSLSCVLQGSSNTCWLAEGEIVVAEGERDKNFHILYPLDGHYRKRDIIPISNDYVPVTFPIVTKVTFSSDSATQNEEETDKEKEGANHGAEDDDKKSDQEDNGEKGRKRDKDEGESGEEGALKAMKMKVIEMKVIMKAMKTKVIVTKKVIMKAMKMKARATKKVMKEKTTARATKRVMKAVNTKARAVMRDK